MVNVYQTISHTPLHLLQATKSTKLEHTKKSAKPYSNCDTQTMKDRLTSKTTEKTLNFPSNIGSLRAKKETPNIIDHLWKIRIV